jgi:hypothetical protein
MDPIAWFLSVIEQSQSADTQENTRMIMVRMLIDNLPLVLLLLGFAAGYLVRDAKSRRKFRRWHERHWY